MGESLMISRKHSSIYQRNRWLRVLLEVSRVQKNSPKSMASPAIVRDMPIRPARCLMFRFLTNIFQDGSYDEMLTNPEIDVVYIGNIHSFRRETVSKCLMADKNVLVEKPFACSLADGEYLIALAKERNLFIMEGMWTRFFPAVQKARDLMMGSATQEPVLGEISKVYADFNFYAADNEEYPTSFFYNRKLGGGASFLVAPYPIAAATLCFKSSPDSIKVVGLKDEATGVDIQGIMTMSFPPTGTTHDGKCPKLPGYVGCFRRSLEPLMTLQRFSSDEFIYSNVGRA